MKKCAPLSHAAASQRRKRREEEGEMCFFFPFFLAFLLCVRQPIWSGSLVLHFTTSTTYISSSSSSSSSSCLNKLKQRATMEASDDDRSSHGLTCHTAPVRFSSLKKKPSVHALFSFLRFSSCFWTRRRFLTAE